MIDCMHQDFQLGISSSWQLAQYLLSPWYVKLNQEKGQNLEYLEHQLPQGQNLQMIKTIFQYQHHENFHILQVVYGFSLSICNQIFTHIHTCVCVHVRARTNYLQILWILSTENSSITVEGQIIANSVESTFFFSFPFKYSKDPFQKSKNFP